MHMFPRCVQFWLDCDTLLGRIRESRLGELITAIQQQQQHKRMIEQAAHEATAPETQQVNTPAVSHPHRIDVEPATAANAMPNTPSAIGRTLVPVIQPCHIWLSMSEYKLLQWIFAEAYILFYRYCTPSSPYAIK